MDLRKQDTRRKIELGGLVVKAGLEHEPRAVVLGALILAANALTSADAETHRAQFAEAGAAAFGDSSP